MQRRSCHLSNQRVGYEVLEAGRVLQRVDDREVLVADALAVLGGLVVMLELLLEAIPSEQGSAGW